jgi:DNA-binding MurR/RpiR family transcriptional regulator
MKTPKLAPDQAGCLIRIQSAIGALKPAERNIADFILTHAEKAIRLSVSELARRAGVGDSTVIRFCRSLGYEGYQEFKLRLAQDLVQPGAYIHQKISFADSTADLIRKICQGNLRAVKDTQRSLDAAMVQAAARAIARARKIDIYGAGYSAFSGLDAKSKLLRLGLVADAFADAHLQAMAAAALTPADVAIGISHTGSSRDVVDALKAARAARAVAIAITNFSPSPITQAADYVLLTATTETPLGGEVLTSRIAQLCVIDVLSAAVALQLGEKCLGFVRRASEAVKGKRY